MYMLALKICWPYLSVSCRTPQTLPAKRRFDYNPPGCGRVFEAIRPPPPVRQWTLKLVGWARRCPGPTPARGPHRELWIPPGPVPAHGNRTNFEPLCVLRDPFRKCPTQALAPGPGPPQNPTPTRPPPCGGSLLPRGRPLFVVQRHQEASRKLRVLAPLSTPQSGPPGSPKPARFFSEIMKPQRSLVIHIIAQTRTADPQRQF